MVFHSPEDVGTDGGPVEIETPVEDGMPVPGKDVVGRGMSWSNVLLGTGGEYGGGGA